MSEKKYRELLAEYQRKNRLYPDCGFSYRPWETGLRAEIKAEIQDGLNRGCGWAKRAARVWEGLPTEVQATVTRHVCESCGAVLPATANPYHLHPDGKIWLCGTCADPGKV